MLERWSKYLGAVLALVLVSGLALVIGAVGVNVLQSVSTLLVAQADWTKTNTVQATFTVRSIMNFYYIVYGVIFLGFFFLMENRLVTTGVPQKLVMRRTCFTLGIELLILAFLQVAKMTYTPVFPLQLGLDAIEILLGIGLIYLGRRKAPISR
jgi:hypothetical protein